MSTVEEVTVRAATPADPPHLPDIEDAAGNLFAGIGMPEVADMPARDVESHCAAQAMGLLWVADAGSAGIVGFALAEAFAESLHLAELSVAPSHGRRGIGAALVGRVANDAIARGYSQLTLSTFADVPWNAPFYRRLGFDVMAVADLPAELQAVRTQEAKVGLALEDRVIMRRTLSRRSRAGGE